MDLTWVSCVATTGEVIAELPGLRVTDSLQQIIGAYSTISATLPIVDGVTPEWEAATEPNAAYLVLLADGLPVDGYIITKHEATEGDEVTLSLASVTAQFDRRYVGDKTYTATNASAIISDLVTTYIADSLPITLSTTASAQVVDREYKDADDKSVYSVLTELSAIDGGPEWAVQWLKSVVSSRVVYRPVLVVADRLGTVPFTGLAPGVTFDMPGAVTGIQFVKDYGSGQGANIVKAVSTAQADVRPESPNVSDIPTGQLKSEYRFTPSTSITSVPTLTAHATAALARMRNGSQAWVLTVNAAEGPQFGVDWWLGDVVALAIAPGATTRWPAGLTVLLRVVGCKWSTEGNPTYEPIVVPL